jgi:hypothetical protein
MILVVRHTFKQGYKIRVLIGHARCRLQRTGGATVATDGQPRAVLWLPVQLCSACFLREQCVHTECTRSSVPLRGHWALSTDRAVGCGEAQG